MRSTWSARACSHTPTTPTRSWSCGRRQAKRARRWGEPDELSTHTRLLAEKRIGFLLLTVGLVLYLPGLVLKSSKDVALMASIAGGVVGADVVASGAFTHFAGARIREQARKAQRRQEPEELPEQ